MCRYIYDWNTVNCDVKQPIQLNSTQYGDRAVKGSRLAFGAVCEVVGSYLAEDIYFHF